MDAEQDSLQNPLGLDETCPNCPVLAERRERVVHGYGDVGADVLVVGEAPTVSAEAATVSFTGDETGRGVQALLADLGPSLLLPTADHPDGRGPTNRSRYTADATVRGLPSTEGPTKKARTEGPLRTGTWIEHGAGPVIDRRFRSHPIQHRVPRSSASMMTAVRAERPRGLTGFNPPENYITGIQIEVT